MTKQFVINSSLYLILAIICLILFCPGINRLPITDRDASLFAQTSKQMLETGQYNKLRFQEEWRHKKPPGIYWLHIGLTKLLSPHAFDHVWPYRVVSLLGALFAVLCCFGFSKKFLGTPVAFLGSLFLASSLLLIVEAHIVTTDAMLLFTIILMQGSLWHCYQSYQKNENPSHIFICLFWLALNLGILVKGVAPITPLLSLLGLFLFDKDYRFIKTLKPGLGLITTVIVSSIWLSWMSYSSGRNFLNDMLTIDLLPKIVSAQESHGAPFFYYMIATPLFFWPISLFLLIGVIYAWQNKQQSHIKFLLAWLIPNFIVFSLVPTKLPQYILPVFPPLALLSSQAIYDIKSLVLSRFLKFSISMYAIFWLFVCIGLGFLLFVASIYFSSTPPPLSASLSFFIIITSFIIFYLVNKNFYKTASYGLILLSIIVIPLVFQFQLPRFNNLWLTNNIYHVIVTQLKLPINKQNPLYSTQYQEPSMVFMLGTKNVVFGDASIAIPAIMQKGHGYALITEHEWREWKTAMQVANLSIHKLSEIHGFRYNKGKWLDLILLSVNNE